MKLRLRRHETKETLKLEFADTATLHDLQQQINPSTPSSVHLSLNRKDELLSPSPDNTLRSLGVTSGDLIYYSLDPSAFAPASIQEIVSASTTTEANQTLAPNETTLGSQSGKNQMSVDESDKTQMSVDESDKNQMSVGESDKNQMSVEDPGEGSSGEAAGMEGPSDPMDIEQHELLDVELAAAGGKRLSEPFFLKKLLLEKSGDTSELTTLAMSVHAVMLESGFVLSVPVEKFSFSKELLTVSLKYTLPELITTARSETEFVTVTFQSLNDNVVVYGFLSGKVQRVYLDKRRFVPVIDSFMDILKPDEEDSPSIYKEIFMFWRMVKDGLVIPLMIGLCDKSGLELPPCFMRLPTELKLKILESLPGVSVAKMACVCTEIRYLASDNDLWKQKCLEEGKNLVVYGSGDSVNWKEKFAGFWRQQQRGLFTDRLRERQLSLIRENIRNHGIRRNRVGFPRILNDPDPFGVFNGDHLHGYVGIQPGQPERGLAELGWRRGFSPRCNLGGRN